ncbi:hypothetical protein VNO77_03284 [Canavalia gladiata]|uniref:Uncharacterized protein n=1 Tax=Canavalia gladiata TaxID=3824 RepID=A0AAN9R6R4_CANGL
MNTNVEIKKFEPAEYQHNSKALDVAFYHSFTGGPPHYSYRNTPRVIHISVTILALRHAWLAEVKLARSCEGNSFLLRQIG